MKIEIQIPTEKETAIANAFAKQFNYSPKISQEVDGVMIEIDNPITKKQFMKEKVHKFIKDVYRQFKVDEIETQKEFARIQADEETNLIIIT